MTLVRIPLPTWGVQLGFLTVIMLLYLTHPQGGIPRWRMQIQAWRWRLILAMKAAPAGLLGSLGAALRLPVALATLDGQVLFNASAAETPLTRLTEWVTYAHFDDLSASHRITFEVSPSLEQL